MVPKLKDVTRFVVQDCETSGLDFQNDFILENATILVDNGKILKELRVVSKQPIKVPDFITKINGITDATLEKEGINPAIACQKIREFMGNELVLGLNNVAFDYPMLEVECNRYYVQKPKIENYVDVGLLAKGIFLGNLWNQTEPFYKYAYRIRDIRAKGVKFNLNFLTKHFECENLREEGVHTALHDVKMTHNIFQKIKAQYYV